MSALLAEMEDAEVQTPSNLVPDSHRFSDDDPDTIGSDAHHPADNPPDDSTGSRREGNDRDDPFAGMDIEELNGITQQFLDGRISFKEDDTPESQEYPETEPIARVAPAPEPVIEQPKPEKVRARFTSEEDIAVVDRARTDGISLIAAARLIASERQDDLAELIDPAAAPAVARTTEPPAGLPFASQAEAEARMLELEEQADIAQLEEYDDKKALALRNELRALRKQLPAISKHEAALRDALIAAQASNYERDYESAKATALEEFPELATPEAEQTPLFREMARLDAEAKTANPALYAQADKYLVLAEKAAANLYRQKRSSTSVPSTAPTQSQLPPRNPVAKGISASPSMARAAHETPAVSGIAAKVDRLEGLSGYALEEALEEIDAELKRR
jgi:hypothetical protein